MTTTTDTGIQRYQTYIHAAPERVWDALTRPEFSVRYGYAPVVDYGAAPGAAYKAYPNEGMKAVASVPAVICDGEILEWQPPRRLVQTFRMLMEPSLAAEGFTRLSYEIEPVRGGVSKLTVTHDVSSAPQLASVVAGRYEDRGAGGGWLEVVSGLKTLLETGAPLPFQSGPNPDTTCTPSTAPETTMSADESKTTTRVEGNDLVLTRVIAASPERIYAAWTQPELLKQWFVPKPWTIASAQLDVRVGGVSHVVMRGPDGNEFPAPGVYLEVVKNRRLVFTDAYTEAWRPSGKPFMTASVDLEDLGGGRTRYTARARHWSQEDREAHEKMGFHEGWSICAEQLAALVEARA